MLHIVFSLWVFDYFFLFIFLQCSVSSTTCCITLCTYVAWFAQTSKEWVGHYVKEVTFLLLLPIVQWSGVSVTFNSTCKIHAKQCTSDWYQFVFQHAASKTSKIVKCLIKLSPGMFLYMPDYFYHTLALFNIKNVRFLIKLSPGVSL